MKVVPSMSVTALVTTWDILYFYTENNKSAELLLHSTKAFYSAIGKVQSRCFQGHCLSYNDLIILTLVMISVPDAS